MSHDGLTRRKVLKGSVGLGLAAASASILPRTGRAADDSLKATPQLPGAKPMAEQGVPGFSALAWWGVIAPAGTPPALVQRMHDELAKALKVPAVAEKLTSQGMDIVGGSPQEMDKFLRGEITRWAEVVKKGNIRAGD